MLSTPCRYQSGNPVRSRTGSGGSRRTSRLNRFLGSKSPMTSLTKKAEALSIFFLLLGFSAGYLISLVYQPQVVQLRNNLSSQQSELEGMRLGSNQTIHLIGVFWQDYPPGELSRAQPPNTVDYVILLQNLASHNMCAEIRLLLEGSPQTSTYCVAAGSTKAFESLVNWPSENVSPHVEVQILRVWQQA